MNLVRQPTFLAEGQSTRIRAFSRRDVDCWQLWPDHPDPLYSTYNPKPMAPSMRDAWYDDLVHRQAQLPFAIEALDRELIGRLFLRHVRRPDGTSVLGIDLHPSYLGQGLGTDAMQAFLGYYFGAAGFRRMFLNVAAYNVRARRGYERLGFRYLGSYWNKLDCAADIFGDSKYASIRSLFRTGRQGLEAMMHDMIIERAEPANGSALGPAGGRAPR